MKWLKKLKGQLPGGWLRGLAAALLFASCAHPKVYLEPSLGSDQVGILNARLPIWIVSIDGSEVSSLSLHDSTSVKLVPGSHVVKVVFQQSGMGHVIDHTALKLQYSRNY